MNALKIVERRGVAKATSFKRSPHELQAHAAKRSLMALDRASKLAEQGTSEAGTNALKWMRLWLAYAASRHRR